MPDNHEIVDLRSFILPGARCIQGSAYDVSLRVDTTPSERVTWPSPDVDRSAYDTNLMIETTPSSHVEWPQTGNSTPSDGTANENDCNTSRAW